jgi:hypothetical protein
MSALFQLIHTFRYGLFILFIELIRAAVDSVGDREGTMDLNTLKYGHELVHNSSASLPVSLLANFFTP